MCLIWLLVELFPGLKHPFPVPTYIYAICAQVLLSYMILSTTITLWRTTTIARNNISCLIRKSRAQENQTFSMGKHTIHSTFQVLSSFSQPHACQHWFDPSSLQLGLTVPLVHQEPPVFLFLPLGSRKIIKHATGVRMITCTIILASDDHFNCFPYFADWIIFFPL